MLVLARKLGEKIYIGEHVCITVVDIDRGKIRLGIEAPRDVPIYREELLPLGHNKHLKEDVNERKTTSQVDSAEANQARTALGGTDGAR